MTGLVYAIMQNLVLLIVAALLGWAVGFFGFRRRKKQVTEQSPATAIPIVPSSDAPSAPPVGDPTSFSGPDVPPAPAAGHDPAGVPVPPSVEEDDDDWETTIIRPRDAVIPSMAEAVASHTSDTAQLDATMVAATQTPARDVAGLTQQVTSLQQELKTQIEAMNRLEAGAVTAWDRTLPVLQEQIDTLEKEKVQAMGQMAELNDRLSQEQIRAEHLQSALNERDKRITELTSS